MRYSNLHTHTDFSDGVHSAEDNVRAAIDLSMISIGISDHCYTYFDTSYCIQADRLSEYKSEVNRLKVLYKDKIEVYLGIELDGFAILPDRADYDYIIGDCHYVQTSDGYIAIDHSRKGFEELAENYFSSDPVLLARSYYHTYAERVRAMRPDVLGHIDLCTKYGVIDESDPRYIKAATEALVASLEVTPFVELNTGAIARGYRDTPYPAIFLIDEIKAHGGRIVLSSDSHNAGDLICHFDSSVELLRSRGIDSIAVYRDGCFNEMEIKG